MELGLEIVDTGCTPEQTEIADQEGFDPIPVFDDTTYQDINAFSDARWERLRYFLDNVRHISTLNDLIQNAPNIVNDLQNLGVFNQDDCNQFLRIVDQLNRYIILGNNQ